MSIQSNFKQKIKIRELVVFSMLATIMFVSKIVMEALPNVHLLGMLTMTYTLVFRKKALVPIYLYVFLNGLYSGFSTWWIPYLYIWTVLWGITILLPKNMSKRTKCIVYPMVCALHGLLFGLLYAPAQALLFGLDFDSTVAWVISGFFFDLLHAIGNFLAGLLIVPISELLSKLLQKY